MSDEMVSHTSCTCITKSGLSVYLVAKSKLDMDISKYSLMVASSCLITISERRN